MKESRTTNVIKNSIARLMQRLSSIIVQFALRTVFIYFLGKEYTGISSLFTDILNVLSLMEAGLDTSMVYALYKPLAEKNEKQIESLLNFYKKAFAIIGIVVLVLGGALIPFLDLIVKNVPNIKEDIRLIFLFYIITSASSYFFVYRTVLLNADQKSRIISKWRTIVLLIECLFEIVFLILLKNFLVYLIFHLIATFVNNLVISRITTNMYPQYFQKKNGEHLSKKETNKVLRDILCLTAYNFSGVVINSTDSIFISAFIGTIEVAIIGNFTLIINSIRTVVSSIVEVTKPSIGNLAATTGSKHQEIVFERMNFISFYVATFCCTCFYSLLNPFIGDIWFDVSYKVAPSIIGVLTLNFYVAVMVLPVESFRTANGLFVQGWMRPIIMAVLNIVLDFFMGRTWGIIGIFLATTISRLVTQVWFDPYLVYKFVFKKKPWRFLIDYLFKLLLATLICLVTGMIAGTCDNGNIIVSFIQKIIIVMVMPNIILGILFWKNSNYRYLLSTAKAKVYRRQKK